MSIHLICMNILYRCRVNTQWQVMFLFCNLSVAFRRRPKPMLRKVSKSHSRSNELLERKFRARNNFHCKLVEWQLNFMTALNSWENFGIMGLCIIFLVESVLRQFWLENTRLTIRPYLVPNIGTERRGHKPISYTHR